jgi:DNA replication initiation complex subunit (GINS family)
MVENDISYKTLRRIQQLEKTSPFLTKIDDEFYYKLKEYLKNLEKEIHQEENPQKIKLFNDEINNTKKIAMNIYEFREKKIVQHALSKVRGAKVDLKNILGRERELFESIVKQILDTREKIMEEAFEGKKNIPNNYNKKEKVVKNKSIIRVLEDIPEFVGTDMKTYTLRKNDILTVSQQMSDSLVQRGVVKQIK